MYKNQRLLLNIILAPLFFVVCWFIGIQVGLTVDKAILEGKLNTSMHLIGTWFIANQRETGDFIYEVQTDPWTPLTTYNIVRQAGSLYSLAQLYRHQPSPELKQTLEKGFYFFMVHAELQGSPGSAAIVHNDVKKSNASALLLVALIEYLEAEPNPKLEILAQQLANYLVSTQLLNGGFVYKPLESQAESHYNNSESLYALIRYYRLSKDPHYLPTIHKAIDYFYTAYPPNEFNGAYFSWAMASFAYMYDLDPQDQYWQYLKTYTNTLLEKSGEKMSSSKTYKAGWGVILEGVAHTAWIAKRVDPEYHAKLDEFMKKQFERLFLLQINAAQGSPDYQNMDPRLTGALCYDTKCQTIRIDTTHHSLSAMYLYLHLVQ